MVALKSHITCMIIGEDFGTEKYEEKNLNDTDNFAIQGHHTSTVIFLSPNLDKTAFWFKD